MVGQHQGRRYSYKLNTSGSYSTCTRQTLLERNCLTLGLPVCEDITVIVAKALRQVKSSNENKILILEPPSEQLPGQLCVALELLPCHAAPDVVWQLFLPDNQARSTTEISWNQTPLHLRCDRLNRHRCELCVYNKYCSYWKNMRTMLKNTCKCFLFCSFCVCTILHCDNLFKWFC